MAAITLSNVFIPKPETVLCWASATVRNPDANPESQEADIILTTCTGSVSSGAALATWTSLAASLQGFFSLGAIIFNPSLVELVRSTARDDQYELELLFHTTAPLTILCSSSERTAILAAVSQPLQWDGWDIGEVKYLTWEVPDTDPRYPHLRKCEGQEFVPEAYATLFDRMGYRYGTGSDDRFKLPDARGRVFSSAGPYKSIGDAYGAESVTLSANQIPPLSITIEVNGTFTDSNTPVGSYLAPVSDFQTYSESLDISGQTLLGGAYANATQVAVNLAQPTLTFQAYIRIF